MLPDRNNPNFPVALQMARIAAGLSRAELARRAGIHGVMPARYENTEKPTVPEQQTWDALNDAIYGNLDHQKANESYITQVSTDDLVAELKRRGATAVSISW